MRRTDTLHVGWGNSRPSARALDGVARPDRVVSFLGACVVLLTVLSLVFQLGQDALGSLGTLNNLFNTGHDGNVPTWFSAVLLLVAAVLLATVAAVRHRAGGKDVGRWAVLAGVFAVASIDEVAMVHEKLGDYLESLELGGSLSYEWVLFGIPLAIVLALAYWRFVLALPRATKILVLAAGATYVAGALGAEMVGGLWEDRSGADSLRYQLTTSLEELLEMTGALLFVHALLVYLRTELGGLSIVVGAQTIALARRAPAEPG